MKPLVLDEIVDVDAYEPLRDAYRTRVLALKHQRRLGVGDRTTLVFENRETVRFQVQEMMRIEHIRTPARVQHELDVYNALVPGQAELSATLFLEITDTRAIRAELDKLLGIDACVFLELAGQRIRARFDASQLEEDRISAVHYLRFDLDTAARARLADPAQPARLAIDHPHYQASAELPAALRESLLADLGGDPAPLLIPPPGASVVAASAPSVSASGRVRVRRAEEPAGRGHVVVEPVAELSAWAEAPADLEAEVLAEVKRIAHATAARFGTCRVVCDLHAPRWRWHVFAPESL